MPQARIIDRQKEFTGTRPVAEPYRLDEGALEDYMRGHVEGFAGPITVEQFKGGQSNPTYRITARSGAYVLRRKPPGKLLPSAHAVDREFRVISALHAQDFPVARPHALCTDEAVLGTMFYIMDCVEGRVYWEPDIPGSSLRERGLIYDAMNETIARLHLIDYEAAGLGDFGKPDGYVARQIKRWSGQYRLSQTEPQPLMDKLMEWLPDACPETSRASLVHGDYRLDNMILHATEPRVLAVLDWELSTLGDPIGDFTYHMMQWRMPPSKDGAGTGSLEDLDLAALGIPTLDAYVEAYCRRTGIAAIDNLDFYFAYNFFRLAAILQGIVGRVRDGTASSPHAAAMASRIAPLAEVAWRYAERAGAQ
jgi:aminoglycoside phosphotransferase (APT) family kinase protein